MKKLIVAAILCALCATEIHATQYSKLSIITAAKERGKWDSLKGWITAAGIGDEWDACSYLSDDYPQYATVTNAVVASGVLTADDLAFILKNAVDTAIPDAALRRVYEQDMSNATGRVKWHGPVVRTVCDTNTLIRVRFHVDGWTFTDTFTIEKPRTVESRISEAERKAKAAEADRKRKEDRLEYLLTHEREEIAKLEKQYPPLLAALLYTNSVNNAKSAVAEFHPVTATINAQ